MLSFGICDTTESELYACISQYRVYSCALTIIRFKVYSGADYPKDCLLRGKGEGPDSPLIIKFIFLSAICD